MNIATSNVRFPIEDEQGLAAPFGHSPGLSSIAGPHSGRLSARSTDYGFSGKTKRARISPGQMPVTAANVKKLGGM